MSRGVTALSPSNAQTNTTLPDGKKWGLLTSEDEPAPRPTNPFKVTDLTGSTFQGRHSTKEKFTNFPFHPKFKIAQEIGKKSNIGNGRF